ncbi:DNA (cytosine-5-)-methyltransferase [uncultured Sanguibacteroides sp.]|uniref:DNA cytosine methyltransferase n=1 Tax=uncultured Sanguibacteroides sp. TaxID=1635151 RepID=UPI0025EAE10E|nr:DNA (cytosine-5-)-methyltransferase [uncultured Sanguibacteroides sp.]
MGVSSVDAGNEGKKIRVLSLFSGCGGMDLGWEGGFSVHKDSLCEARNPDFVASRGKGNFVKLKPTRFELVFANDILREARTAWVYYFKKYGYSQEIYRNESIVDLVKRHRAGEQVFPENVDVVTGGFPCQDFSVAGKRKGFNSRKDHNGRIIEGEMATEETRGKLYMWMKEVISITKPKIFIAENVKGLVNLSNVKEIIQHDFSMADEHGYIVLEPQVLHAADYGVPQSRERVIFIGIRKSALKEEALQALIQKTVPDNYNPYPKVSHAFHDERNKELAKPQTLAKVFAGLKEPEESHDPSQMYYSRAKFMGTHCQGQTEVDIQGIGPTIRAEHHGNIEYRRLSKEHGGQMDRELKRGLKERRLTPRECALIQTFPPDYEFVIPKEGKARQFVLSPSAAYKIIGNAVPPLLAYHIARRIESLWNLYFE